MNRDTDLGNPLDDPRLASAVFFPRPDRPFGPAIPGARDHMVDVPEARIRIREFPGAKGAPIILFFHGNGETAADYDHAAADYAGLPGRLFVADYRGYGPSTGRPSLKAMLADAHAALGEITRLATADGGRVPIVVMGRSLGSAPASNWLLPGRATWPPLSSRAALHGSSRCLNFWGSRRAASA